MISKKVYNLAAGIITMFVPLVYFFGVYEWRVNEFSEISGVVDHAKHLYFVSFSSAFYILSFAFFMVSDNPFVKVPCAFTSSCCAVILYQEVAYGDEQWTEWSYWLIAVVSANYLILYCIIEKIKRLTKDGNKSSNHN